MVGVEGVGVGRAFGRVVGEWWLHCCGDNRGGEGRVAANVVAGYHISCQAAQGGTWLELNT